jgi:hypothetical protein
MLERAGPVSGQKEKEGHAHIRHKIDGKEYTELGDLLEGKGSVDG